jgi:hypothetical protein
VLLFSCALTTSVPISQPISAADSDLISYCERKCRANDIRKLVDDASTAPSAAAVSSNAPSSSADDSSTAPSVLADESSTAPSMSTYSSDTNSSRPLPNIVVFMVDDLGWNQVGYHANAQGNDEIHTPSIDKHALDGIQVDRGYATPCESAELFLLFSSYRC